MLSGALAPRISLKVTLLTACLRSQDPEDDSLSWLCLWTIWVEGFIASMRFPRAQFRNPRTWPYWKCNRLFPSVELALSGPEKALQWLLSESLRYSFWKIYGDELEGLALIAQGQKSTFPHWAALYYLFCYHIYWCGGTQKGYFGVFVHPLMTYCLYCS